MIELFRVTIFQSYSHGTLLCGSTTTRNRPVLLLVLMATSISGQVLLWASLSACLRLSASFVVSPARAARKAKTMDNTLAICAISSTVLSRPTTPARKARTTAHQASRLEELVQSSSLCPKFEFAPCVVAVGVLWFVSYVSFMFLRRKGSTSSRLYAVECGLNTACSALRVAVSGDGNGSRGAV